MLLKVSSSVCLCGEVLHTHPIPDTRSRAPSVFSKVSKDGWHLIISHLSFHAQPTQCARKLFLSSEVPGPLPRVWQVTSGVNGAGNPGFPLSREGECRGVKVQVQALNLDQPSLHGSNHGHLRKRVPQVNPNFSGEVRVKSWCFLLLEHTLKTPNSLQTLPWEDLREASGLLFPWLQPWLCEQASLSSVYREGDSGIKINIDRKQLTEDDRKPFHTCPGFY